VCAPLSRASLSKQLKFQSLWKINKEAMWFSRNSPRYIVQTHHIHLLIHLQAESTAELSLNVLSKRRKGESNVKTMLFISNQLNQGQIFHGYNSLSLNFLDECKRKSKKRTAILYIISSLTKEKKRRKTKRKEKLKTCNVKHKSCLSF